jgi:cyanophycin synthetase
MDVRNVLALRGPNIWAHFPVLEAWIDLGPLEDPVADEPPAFDGRIRDWVPALLERLGGCGGTRIGLSQRLQCDNSAVRVLERLVLELQRLAGAEVSFGRTRETSQPDVYKVACEYEHEELGRAAIAAARELYLAAVQSRPLDLAGEVAKLREVAERLRPAPLAAAVTKAALRRGVPVRPLGEGLLLLGQGSRQRRVLGARTDRTAALAESIALDQGLTRKLLRQVGVPVHEPDDPEARRWRVLVVGGHVAAVRGIDPPADVTGPVHPDVAARASEAAEVIGLDVAGVVMAARDLGRPLEGQAGVVAVEADPPVEACAADAVGEAIVAGLFGDKEDGRVPVVAVTGVNGKTTTTRLIAHVLTRAQRQVGMTCTEGIYVGGQLVEAGDCSGPRSAQTVLQHPEVEAAVLETARGGILRAGLGFDRCDVAVVTNIGEGDHLGSAEVETAEQLARVKRVIVEAVRPGGTAVLGADDPLVAAMASHCGGSVTFFSRDPIHPVIAAHRAAGGRAAFVREGRIFLAEGARETPVASLAAVPLTGGGRIGFQVENVLAAVAVAHALGVDHRTIRAALRSFGPGIDHAPARFNLLEVNGAVAVLDYGHNASSLAAIIETLSQFPPTYRTAVYTAAGDRRDADMIRQGELLGDAFDRVILYEDGNCTRGRKPGEIIGLFRKGLADRPRACKVQEVEGAVRAVALALSTALPGELLLVQVDVVEETLDLVRGYLAAATARETTMEEALAILSGARGEPPAPTGAAGRSPKGAGLPRGSWRSARGEVSTAPVAACNQDQ